MHISSLPGDFGIGTLGDNARKFVDFLKKGRFSCWQILPVNELDEYNSPYKSPSAFAGNPHLIDLEELAFRGLLTFEELSEARQKSPYLCEFDFLRKTRIGVLKKAFLRIDKSTKCEVEEFCAENLWVSEYATFRALKEMNGEVAWQEWKTLVPDETKVDFYCFLQYEFFRQWMKLKEYANSKGIEIIGDMPIYVASDSADVYFNKKLFNLDENGEALESAGVPPDYFAAEGQAWGNPLYNWDEHKKDNYAWWTNRIGHSLKMFDKVRIDHFRAFAEYFAIPKGSSPVAGQWKVGPGIDFFNKLKKSLPNPGIIAEDLGVIDSKVVDLLAATDFPGMRVMQFGFISDENNPHLPHNYMDNSVAYTGTHDNNTLLGWLWELTLKQREYALKYCGFYGDNWGDGGYQAEALRAIIRTMYQSSAGLVILPIQDLCGFGRDTRVNTPGTMDGNWEYRITWDQLSNIDIDWFARMNGLYKRI